MTVQRTSFITVQRTRPASAGDLTSGLSTPTIINRVQMRAQCRHQGLVVTISGDVDATNIDSVSDYTRRLVLVGQPVILDLSGVTFIAAQAIPVLIALDEACLGAELPWALVPSHPVRRLLRISDHDTVFPTASSVPKALRHFADLARARRRPPLVSKTA